jgi:putative transposase
MKYRYKVLQGALRERIREITIQTCEELGVHIVKGVLARDHVRMFLSIPPKLSLCDVMQRIKGRSSSRIQIEFPDLRSATGTGAFGRVGICPRPPAT